MQNEVSVREDGGVGQNRCDHIDCECLYVYICVVCMCGLRTLVALADTRLKLSATARCPPRVPTTSPPAPPPDGWRGSDRGWREWPPGKREERRKEGVVSGVCETRYDCDQY